MTLLRFLRDSRAGATGLVAAMVTVMTVAGTALIGDHLWLVDQRDALQSASDAAGVAANLEMSRLMDEDRGISDDDLAAALTSVAERYVLLNLQHLPPNRLAHAEQTLQVSTTPNRRLRTVDVWVEADLGGTLLARHMPMFGDVGESGLVRTDALVKSTVNPIEVVLAIDISDSMDSLLDGTLCKYDQRCYSVGDNSRIAIVKRAAAGLVDILEPDADARIAVGVVPWHRAVRLDPGTATEWAQHNRVRYPARRVYGEPYDCLGTGCTPPAAVEQALPATPPVGWNGCLDSHRTGTGGVRAALPAVSEFFTPPSANPFAQRIFPATQGSAYECLTRPLPADLNWQICYHGTRHTHSGGESPPHDPLRGCAADNPSILPLSTDGDAIRQAIDSLTPVGARTYSALGVLWGQRLLDHAWTDAWGGGAHPVDPDDRDNESLRKVIVLLTDGDDTHCGIGNPACANSVLGFARADACEAARAQGTEIFVIAAMPPGDISSALGDALRACSSESDDPDGNYAFLNNATPEHLEAAFAEIAGQLTTTRRIE